MNYRSASCYHGDNMNRRSKKEFITAVGWDVCGGVGWGVVDKLLDSIFSKCVTLPMLMSDIDNTYFTHVAELVMGSERDSQGCRSGPRGSSSKWGTECPECVEWPLPHTKRCRSKSVTGPRVNTIHSKLFSYEKESNNNSSMLRWC